MTLKAIIIGILMISSTTVAATAYASQISTHAIDTRPEEVCLTHGAKPEMKDLCDWINICDDTGEFNSTHGFCTGYVVRNPPGKGTCPTGFHSTDDDESGLCYKNMGPTGCEYEDMILKPGNRSCGEIQDVCQEYSNLTAACTVTINLGIPENSDYKCEFTVPDHCFTPYKEGEVLSNGTHVPSTQLYCRDVNATDFRVTVQDRHNFDTDYDNIGCEKAFQDVRDILFQ